MFEPLEEIFLSRLEFEGIYARSSPDERCLERSRSALSVSGLRLRSCERRRSSADDDVEVAFRLLAETLPEVEALSLVELPVSPEAELTAARLRVKVPPELSS